MCGIVAVYSRSGQVSVDSLNNGLSALHHRGPDGEGHWVSADGRVGIGHRRLSIVDLLGGAQPISNEDHNVHIAVNGEFYDDDRIRRDLMARGHVFRTASDSEIAVHLYEELGVQCLEQLRGEFAFVLWDDRNKVLLAARDRFGIKPLNYAEVDGTLYCGSEIKALFALGVKPTWDREQVYQELFHFANADRSLFDGIHQVAPGHCLVATPGSTRTVRYWDFNYPVVQSRAPHVAEEAVDRMRGVLLDAVRLRLRADVPVGCFLSGGLDSSAILGMATHLAGGPITAFTISFEDALYDEAKAAEAMACRVGAPFHCFDVHDQIRADNFRAAVTHNETVTHGHMVAKYVLSERVRDLGYKVVLTGEGADEVFAGYTPFLWDSILGDDSLEWEAKEAQLARVRSLNLLFPTAFEAINEPIFDSVRRRLGFVPAGFAISASRSAFLNAVLAPDFATEFAQRDPFTMSLDALDFEQLRARPRLHQSLYIWSKVGMPSHILRGLGDRAEMAHSIEGRLPFLDHKVVELAVQVPPFLKVKDLNEKHFLREAVRPFVSPEIFARRKHQFSAPSVLLGHFGAMLRDTINSSVLESVPFFDARRVRDLMESCFRGREGPTPSGAAYVLLAAASLCVLQEGFGVGEVKARV